MPRDLRWSVALVATAFVLPVVARGEGRELKPIATVKDVERSGSMGPVQFKREGQVFRNAEELVRATAQAKSAKEPAVQKEVEAEVAKLLKVDGIDWGKQMVIAVIAESVDSFKADDKMLTATFVPYKEPLTRAVPPTPKFLILVERFEGEVKFVPKKK